MMLSSARVASGRSNASASASITTRGRNMGQSVCGLNWAGGGGEVRALRS